MIRLSLLFFLIVTKLGVFAQEVSPSEFYFPRSLVSVNASLQRMDLFTGVAYQKNLKKIDIGGSLALGIRSTFGAQQVNPQLGFYMTIPYLKHCNRKGAIALGPMLSFHASFFDMGIILVNTISRQGIPCIVGKLREDYNLFIKLVLVHLLNFSDRKRMDL